MKWFTENSADDQASVERRDALVLVIDDEYMVRTAVLDLLTFSGFPALGAASGAEGLRLLEEYAKRIRLILLDLNMPGMNGLETLQRIRQGAPVLPVILCSGMADRPQSLRTDLALGFLAKPYSLDALVTLVSAAYMRQPA